ELPEVETVVRDLRPLVVGRTIAALSRTSDRALRRPWQAEWAARLAGRRIEGVRRRGKWILLDLDGGLHLVMHLGMTGQLTLARASGPRAAHPHLVSDRGEGRGLRFRDPRRFGSATLLDDTAALEGFFEENGLGPEPFDLDPKAWRQALGATTRSVKAVL